LYGTAEAQHVFLLLALRAGDDDQRLVAACIADEREADPGVASGAFDDQPAGLEQAALFCVEDEVEAGAILDRAAGVQELGLAEDFAAGELRSAAQADERRVADRFDEAASDRHLLAIAVFAVELGYPVKAH
jgi:hypothetical protein